MVMELSWYRLRKAQGVWFRQLRWKSERAAAASSRSSQTFTSTKSAPVRIQRALSSARPLADDEYEPEWDEGYSSKTASQFPTPPFRYTKADPPLLNSLSTDSSTAMTVTETMTPPQESFLSYTEDSNIPITSSLHIVKPEEDIPSGVWPVFRLMEQSGEFRDPSYDGFDTPVLRYDQPFSASNENPQELEDFQEFLAQNNHMQEHEIMSSGLLQPSKYPFQDTESTNTLLRAHRQIIRLRQMDDILLNAQRQGRISFYMTCRGEEAIHMGAASALNLEDPVFAQYREQGVLMWRGFTLEQFTNQCFSNELDLGKGRQMPVHYGSRALNYHTVSSPLGTQLPQAVGAAYRLKLEGKPNAAICFFGDGCASTTDFHSALNFASTLGAPVVFFCRNNGYAISTPTSDQYAGDGVVSRAPGYGMAGIRVDGNDVFAVHAAVREAKRYAVEHSAPVLIEAMTYRQGHHSTSDDSLQYRSSDEIEGSAQKGDPLDRLEAFLQKYGWLSEEDSANMHKEERQAVVKAMKQAENRAPPPIEALFSDVYKEMPRHLVRQQEELRKHLRQYPDK